MQGGAHSELGHVTIPDKVDFSTNPTKSRTGIPIPGNEMAIKLGHRQSPQNAAYNRKHRRRRIGAL